MFTQMYDNPEDPSSAESSTESNTSIRADQDEPVSSDEDHELHWDSSPEQYELSPTYQNDHELVSKPPIIDSTSTSRRHAISEHQLSRSNAFRRNPLLPPPAPRKPRIPVPTSPSDVPTNMVSDVSNALATINTRIYTNSNRPRRSTPRPDYLQLHTTGRRQQAANSTGGENNQQGPRKHRPKVHLEAEPQPDTAEQTASSSL